MEKPGLLEEVRLSIRRKHYSHLTEQSYIYWIRYFIRFYKLRHPRDMRENEVRQFLDHLSTARKISASPQNQALCDIEFEYHQAFSKGGRGVRNPLDSRS